MNIVTNADIISVVTNNHKIDRGLNHDNIIYFIDTKRISASNCSKHFQIKYVSIEVSPFKIL